MMIKTYQITPFCEHMLIRFACNHLNGRMLSKLTILFYDKIKSILKPGHYVKFKSKVKVLPTLKKLWA